MKKLNKMIRIVSIALVLCGTLSLLPQIQHPKGQETADDHGGGHS